MASKLKPLDQQVIVTTRTAGDVGLGTALLPAERGARVKLAARNRRTLGTIVPGTTGNAYVAHAGVGRQ
jgi:hypothetical protein